MFKVENSENLFNIEVVGKLELKNYLYNSTMNGYQGLVPKSVNQPPSYSQNCQP